MAWRNRRLWAPAALWAAAILIGSSIPGARLALLDLEHGSDKLAHCGEYLVLGLLLARALGPRATFRLLLATWAAVAVFGALDELHQAFIPGRTPDVLDWTADTTGATVGLLAGRVLVRLRSGRRAAARSPSAGPG